MFSPDCICVCSFSTTSPSPIRSCVTLMPVMAVKAVASILDSYSCVVMVSETTLMSMPAKGFGGIDEPLHLGFLVGAVERRQVADLGVEERLGLVHAGIGAGPRPAAATSALVDVRILPSHCVSSL